MTSIYYRVQEPYLQRGGIELTLCMGFFGSENRVCNNNIIICTTLDLSKFEAYHTFGFGDRALHTRTIEIKKLRPKGIVRVAFLCIHHYHDIISIRSEQLEMNAISCESRKLR